MWEASPVISSAGVSLFLYRCSFQRLLVIETSSIMHFAGINSLCVLCCHNDRLGCVFDLYPQQNKQTGNKNKPSKGYIDWITYFKLKKKGLRGFYLWAKEWVCVRVCVHPYLCISFPWQRICVRNTRCWQEHNVVAFLMDVDRYHQGLQLSILSSLIKIHGHYVEQKWAITTAWSVCVWGGEVWSLMLCIF